MGKDSRAIEFDIKYLLIFHANHECRPKAVPGDIPSQYCVCRPIAYRRQYKARLVFVYFRDINVDESVVNIILICYFFRFMVSESKCA